MWVKKVVIGAFLVLIVGMLLFFTHTHDLTWNDRSRFATIESLSRGTLQIDQSTFLTGDKVFARGHFFSDKPPFLSVFLAGAYKVISSVGINFQQHRAMTIYLLTLFASTIPFISFFIYLGKQAWSKTNLSKNKFLFLVGSLAVGTVLFPYATVLNNHLIAGVLCGIMSVSFFYKNALVEKNKLLLFGLLAGLAITFDLAALFITVSFIFYLLFTSNQRSQRLKSTGIFLLGLTVPIFIHWLINRTITGDIWPASMHPELFNYPGSAFTQSNLTNAGLVVSSIKSWLYYVYAMLGGRRGFLSLSPLIVVALGYILFIIANKQYSASARLHALATLGSFVGVIGYYSLYGRDFGGPTYAVRWLVILVPLVLPYLIDVATSSHKIYYFIISIALVSALWNVPASGSVFSNLNGFSYWQGIVVMQKFPTYLKSLLESKF